jgi:sigma-B regulation protein RsbU (phosphoserine phosphatase)
MLCRRLSPRFDVGDACVQLLAPFMRSVDADRGSILVLEPDQARLRLQASRGLPEEAQTQAQPIPLKSVSQWVLQTQQGVVLHGRVTDPRFEDSVLDADVDSSIALPLCGPYGPIGILNLARLTSGDPFTEDDLSALTPWCEAAGRLLQQLQRDSLAHETLYHFMAGAVGSMSLMLPCGPSESRGFELAYTHRSGYRFGSNTCDRIVHPDGDTFLFIDPVKGGPVAATASAFTHALLVTLAETERAPARLLERLQRELPVRHTIAPHVGVWVGTFDRQGGLKSSCAGSPIALWVPADGGPAIPLGGGQPPIGARSETDPQEVHVRLLPKDLVVVASDGVVNALNLQGERFGDQRLAELLTGLRQRPLEHVVEAVNAAVLDFSRRPTPLDDLAIFALRYHPTV